MNERDFACFGMYIRLEIGTFVDPYVLHSLRREEAKS